MNWAGSRFKYLFSWNLTDRSVSVSIKFSFQPINHVLPPTLIHSGILICSEALEVSSFIPWFIDSIDSSMAPLVSLPRSPVKSHNQFMSSTSDSKVSSRSKRKSKVNRFPSQFKSKRKRRNAQKFRNGLSHHSGTSTVSSIRRSYVTRSRGNCNDYSSIYNLSSRFSRTVSWMLKWTMCFSFRFDY